MAALTGNSVGTSYQGLLKTTDNAAIDGNLKNMTDGLGNATPLSMANNYVQLQAPTIELIESTGGTNLMQITSTNVYFEGAVDFTNASVTGIGGGGGLVNGTGVSGVPSLKVDDSLLTTPAQATAGGNIAIGDNARALGTDNFARSSVAIGTNAQTGTNAEGAIAFGKNSNASGARSVAISEGATATGLRAVAIGQSSQAYGFRSKCVGDYSYARATNSNVFGSGSQSYAENAIVIGTAATDADAARVNSITIGTNINTAQYSVNIGNDQNNYSADSVMIGNSNVIGNNYHVMVGYGNNVTGADNQIAIGRGNTSALADTGVIGYNLTSLWAGGITMNQIALANYANLNFADDTAAAAGNVPLGGVYHTSGALKVRTV